MFGAALSHTKFEGRPNRQKSENLEDKKSEDLEWSVWRMPGGSGQMFGIALSHTKFEDLRTACGLHSIRSETVHPRFPPCGDPHRGIAKKGAFYAPANVGVCQHIDSCFPAPAPPKNRERLCRGVPKYNCTSAAVDESRRRGNPPIASWLVDEDQFSSFVILRGCGGRAGGSPELGKQASGWALVPKRRLGPSRDLGEP